MVRRFVAVVFAVAVVTGLVAPVAGADTQPPNGGQVTDGCRTNEGGIPSVPGAVTPGPAACRNVAQVDWGLARACRTVAASSPEQCDAVDGRAISPADLKAYQSSWVHRALTLQRGIDLAAPLFESLLPHTHNTFNSSAYSPTLTNNDPNQVYSITDQLNMDIRLIEMDLHWVPSPSGNADTGGYWVTLCHGDSGNPLGVHVGCTNDRPFQDGLAEVKAWLVAQPAEFVVIYLENQLSGDASAHALAAKLINDAVGGVTEKPATPCAPMDWSRSRSSMLDAGHRVLFVGNCGAGNGLGTAWGTTVFDRGPKWDEGGGQEGYSPTSTKCAADKAKHGSGVFRRYFEDSTWLAAMVGSNAATSSLGGTSTLDAAQTAAMVGCGVNIIGLDQLTPTDPRLASLVWSWAKDEPRAGAGECAVQGSDSRFRAAPCNQPKRFACVGPTGAWQITAAAKPWDKGWQACAAEFSGSRFAAPVNGFGNGQLKSAKGAVADVWVNYGVLDGQWRANTVTTVKPTKADQHNRVAAPASSTQSAGAGSGVPLNASPASSSHRGAGIPAIAFAVALMLAVGMTAAGRRTS